MQILESAGVIIYRETDESLEYLIINHENGDHWDFPKGKIEPGESKKEAAMRELKEETNLSATLLDGFETTFSYFFTDHDGQKCKKTVTFFAGQAGDEPVRLSYEHVDYAWLPCEEALEQLTYTNAQQALQEAHTFIITQQQ